jgi:hypothetical protein
MGTLAALGVRNSTFRRYFLIEGRKPDALAALEVRDSTFRQYFLIEGRESDTLAALEIHYLEARLRGLRAERFILSRYWCGLFPIFVLSPSPMKKPIAYRITSLLLIENPSDYHQDEADHKTESNRNFRTGRQLVARAVSIRRRKSDG